MKDFVAFARLSGDDNGIHTDPDFAARTRFGRPVAHGLLLCAILQRLAEDKIGPSARLSEMKVQFPAPSHADEALRFTASLTATPGEVAVKAERLAGGEVTVTGLMTFRTGAG